MQLNYPTLPVIRTEILDKSYIKNNKTKYLEKLDNYFLNNVKVDGDLFRSYGSQSILR